MDMKFKLFMVLFLISFYSCTGYRSTVPGKNTNIPRVYTGEPQVEGDVQTGIASWYGIEEHNNKAASGERFDKNELTAAHKTLPMDTIVRVTNLDNGKDVVVRINDRGPFVKDRIIDLSYAAANQIEMFGPGTAPVKVEIISIENREEKYFDPKYMVQIASFKNEDNAAKLKSKLESDFKNIFIQEIKIESDKYFRVRIGAFDTRKQAEEQSKRLKKLGYKPTIKLE